jgi:hypothetical protein
MSKTKTPITRREILIGGAAAVAVDGLAALAAADQPTPAGAPAPQNNCEEELT